MDTLWTHPEEETEASAPLSGRALPELPVRLGDERRAGSSTKIYQNSIGLAMIDHGEQALPRGHPSRGASSVVAQVTLLTGRHRRAP